MILQQYIVVLLLAFGGTPPSEIAQPTLENQLKYIVGDVEVTESHPTIKEAAQEYIIGRQLAAQDKHAQAIKHLQLAIRLDGKAPASWAALAVSLAALGRAESSIQVWKEVVARDPSHSDAILILGLDAARLANFELAQRYLAQSWLQQKAEPLEALLRDAALISVTRSLGDVGLAHTLQKTLQINIEVATSQLVKGANSDIWRGVLQQLIDVNATSVAMNLTIAAANRVHGEVLATLLSALPVLEASLGGDGSSTKRIYEEVSNDNKLPLSPRWFEPVALSEALSTAAQMMSIHGARDASILLYESAILYEPTNALIVNNIAWSLLLRDGSTPRVIELCNQAIKLDPSAAYIKDTVGWMYVLQGQPEKGIPYFLEALGEANQPSPETYSHLGDAYWVIGEEDNAARSWQIAAALLHSAGTRKNAIDGFATLENSVWGISVTTPEALYDLELGKVARSLTNKLAAIADGRNPEVDVAALQDGDN